MERRSFITVAAAGAVAAGASGATSASASAGDRSVAAAVPRPIAGATTDPFNQVSFDSEALLRVREPGERRGDMLYRALGKTGEKVSLLGLGGAHLGRSPVDEALAVTLIHSALDRGINFLDNSWDYNQGESERRMGKALSQSGYRNKAFLMTKIDGRTRESAEAQLNTSLERLRTDHIDLIQLHEIIRFEDADRIFGESGAIEAVIAARKAGKVRYIGFTGHKDPHIHLYMLSVAADHGFHFDTVQMPLNVMDAHFRSFGHLVLPRLIEQQIGAIGMKTMGDGVILKSGAPITAIDCLHYAMNLPTSTVVTGVDSEKILDQAFEAARTFKPLEEAEVKALLAKTESYAKRGEFELFKTSQHFDSTAQHPDWLGGPSPSVQKLAPPSA